MGKRVITVVVAGVVSFAIAISGANMATASPRASTENSTSTAASLRVNASPNTQCPTKNSVPEGYTASDFEAELNFLSKMSAQDQEEFIRNSLGQEGASPRIGPAVIVFALTCAIGAATSLYGTDWSSEQDVVKALAGALLGCIPGSRYEQLVSLIWRHRGVIARALRMLGAGAAAAMLLTGDSPQE